MRTRLLSAVVAVGIGGALLTGCAADDEETLTVFAASSLTEVFETLAADFEDDHPGTEVRFSFSGSSTLAQQIVAGAPADVFAAASPATMDTAAEAGMVGEATAFAANRIVAVVPPDNPAGLERLEDLDGADLRLAVCAPGVPCGDATAELLDRAGIAIAPASEESNVRSVRAKVATGEVDAGFVYATDVTDEVLALPTPDFGRTGYEIAAVAGAGDLAQDWIDLVTSDRGRQVLEEAGFSEACQSDGRCSEHP